MAPLVDKITVNADESGTYEGNKDRMKDRYKNSFLIGNIYNAANLSGTDKEILLRHFNAITAENLMKPDAIAPCEGVYQWADADQMVQFAADNGLKVIGHTLIWHQQTPTWLTDGTADEVWTNMKDYIQTVVGHYKGKIMGWDVVNEAIRDDLTAKPDTWRDCIRKDSALSGTPWYRALEDDEYIYKAYLLAHEADPEAELYYNDYNLDMPYKREAAALLVKHINDKYKQEYNTNENLIDAIGMQSHYSLDTNISDVKASIERFREIGVRINITELDICLNRVEDNGIGDSSSANVTLTPSLEMKQAVKYAELMSLYEANADIIDRVTFWGYNDAQSWRSAQYPLMFNADFTPKKAFYAIMQPEYYR